MDIRPIAVVPPGPQGLDALAATASPAQDARPEPEAGRRTLEPAAEVALTPGAHALRFVRDADTSAMVFQVVDPHSGDVVVQSPTVSALRNRAYAARAQVLSGGVARSA